MVKVFEKYPEILAILSEKTDGSMRLFPESQEIFEAKNRANRERLFLSQDIDPQYVISTELVHGNTIQRVSRGSDVLQRQADGLITQERGLYLSVTVADCLPLYLYDPITGTIGLVHAGWRGIKKDVIKSGLKAFGEAGSDTRNIKVAIGPHIRQCHFEVSAELQNLFPNDAVKKKESKYFVDLEGIVVPQLVNGGILEENIEANELCTFCEKERFFSYRRDKPPEVEAMAAIIGLKG